MSAAIAEEAGGFDSVGHIPVRFHTCPVCRREIAETRGVVALFWHHNDKAGGWCPMSGQPIPECPF